MEIGAWVGNNGPATPDHMLSVAQTADRTGLASIWAADHLLWPVEYESKYPYGGDKYPADYNQSVCEVITTMTWLSAHTTRVRVGSLVIVVPQRNPWILGRQLATLDNLNGGRTILGAGIGWLREEFEALQMPFDRRIARTAEAIELMRSMWSEHPVSFEGQFWRTDPVGVLPPTRFKGRFRSGWAVIPGEHSSAPETAQRAGFPTDYCRRISDGDGTL